jgi:hypothetical protein
MVLSLEDFRRGLERSYFNVKVKLKPPLYLKGSWQQYYVSGTKNDPASYDLKRLKQDFDKLKPKPTIELEATCDKYPNIYFGFLGSEVDVFEYWLSKYYTEEKGEHYALIPEEVARGTYAKMTWLTKKYFPAFRPGDRDGDNAKAQQEV